MLPDMRIQSMFGALSRARPHNGVNSGRPANVFQHHNSRPLNSWLSFWSLAQRSTLRIRRRLLRPLLTAVASSFANATSERQERARISLASRDVAMKKLSGAAWRLRLTRHSNCPASVHLAPRS